LLGALKKFILTTNVKVLDVLVFDSTEADCIKCDCYGYGPRIGKLCLDHKDVIFRRRYLNSILNWLHSMWY